jgi:YaaC-like Protein
MLWWALLFGLSSIARYDPETWIDALVVNDSELAVPIEAALDVALEALPELILDALTPPRASHRRARRCHRGEAAASPRARGVRDR